MRTKASLLETYLRADVVRGPGASSFGRLGFKTEARLLKLQGDQVIKLVEKAIADMPAVDPWELMGCILGGGMTPAHREKRQQRGEYFERIGKAERVMLRTLRNAFDSLYKSHADWTRRQQLQATTRMMNAIMKTPKEKAQSLLSAASNPPEPKK